MPDEIEQVITDALDDLKTKRKQLLFIEEFNKDIEQNLRALRNPFFRTGACILVLVTICWWRGILIFSSLAL
jgi:hypothetical protein